MLKGNKSTNPDFTGKTKNCFETLFSNFCFSNCSIQTVAKPIKMMADVPF